MSPMNPNKLRFGILGCGMIAGIHAAAIRSLPEAELAGAADSRPDAARIFCEKNGGVPYADEAALLADDSIDVVCICTPSHLHADSAIRALKSGKHVALEKPMALNTEDAEKIRTACLETGRMLTVISQLRFSPDVRRVKELVEQESFGQLVFCSLNMCYWRSEEYFSSSAWRGRLAFEGGGALMNQGIHGIDLMQYILGEPTVLKGEIRTLHHDVEVEDTAMAMVGFGCGALGSIRGSTCTWPGFERRLEIHGNKGFVILRENQIEQLHTPEEFIDRRDEPAAVASASEASALESDLHAKQLLNLIDAIRGRDRLLIDAEEGLKAIRIIESIYRSAARQ